MKDVSAAHVEKTGSGQKNNGRIKKAREFFLFCFSSSPHLVCMCLFFVFLDMCAIYRNIRESESNVLLARWHWPNSNQISFALLLLIDFSFSFFFFVVFYSGKRWPTYKMLFSPIFFLISPFLRLNHSSHDSRLLPSHKARFHTARPTTWSVTLFVLRLCTKSSEVVVFPFSLLAFPSQVVSRVWVLSSRN